MSASGLDSPEVEPHRILGLGYRVGTLTEDLPHRVFPLGDTTGDQFATGYLVVRNQVAPLAELCRRIELLNEVRPQLSNQLQD